ncbi:MAG: hypothetical protein NVS1B10_08910 [Candidatus Saccharimonadales bacterium]
MSRMYPKSPSLRDLAPVVVSQDPATMEFDVTALLAQGGAILQRELRSLMSESSGGKLAPNSARDLVAYVKLLNELEKQQKAELAAMDDQELEEIAK